MITLSDLFQTNKKQDPLTWYKKQKSLTWYEIKIMESFNRKSPLADEFAKSDEWQTPRPLNFCDPSSFTEYPQILPLSGKFFPYSDWIAEFRTGLTEVKLAPVSDKSTGEAPEYCSQCIYYEGIYLHCSVHPNGIDDELSCPDFIRKSDKVLLDEENTFSSLLKMLDR